MFFSRRDHSGRIGHLDWRIRLFSIGAGLALGGIWLESSWLIYGAIVSLMAGMAVRFVPASEAGEESVEEN